MSLLLLLLLFAQRSGTKGNALRQKGRLSETQARHLWCASIALAHLHAVYAGRELHNACLLSKAQAPLLLHADGLQKDLPLPLARDAVAVPEHAPSKLQVLEPTSIRVGFRPPWNMGTLRFPLRFQSSKRVGLRKSEGVGFRGGWN